MIFHKILFSITVLLITATIYQVPNKTVQEKVNSTFVGQVVAGNYPVDSEFISIQDVAENRRVAAMPDGMKRDQATRAKLQQVVSIEYDEIELGEVMEELKTTLGTEIHLDQSCKDDSLTLDQPVTFKIRECPAGTAIREMLFEHNATYVVRNGLMKFISRDVAEDPDYFTRRYLDVSDVLAELARREPNRVGKFVHRKWMAPTSGGVFNQAGGGGGFGGGGRGSKLNSPPNDENLRVFAEEVEVSPEELLIDTIKSTVDTDGWDSTAGEGNLHILGGVLIVNSTEHTANEVEDLLQNLRHNWSK